MDGVRALRLGYSGLGLALAGLTLSTVLPLALVAGLLFGFLGAIALLLGGDRVPKWAGIGLLAYFAVALLLFVAATPVTIRLEGAFSGFINDDPPEILGVIARNVLIASPLVVAVATAVATWQREAVPRYAAIACVAGIIVIALLTLLLGEGNGEDTQFAAAELSRTGGLLRGGLAVSAAAGAVAAFWSAARPEEV